MAEDVAGGGHGQAPIIIKKIVKGGHGHHGGAWKVAYADMVTALMALFIVLWILSQSDEVVKSVAGYFNDPVGFRSGGVPSLMEGGTQAGTPAVLEESRPSNVGAEDEQAEIERWKGRARRIMDALAQLPTFDKYRDQVEMTVTSDGLRISLTESSSTPLYQVGGVALNPEASGLLQALGEELSELENSLVIEGHTDSRPFTSSSGMTNWELSTGRAHTARTVLESAGVKASKVFEVRGFADRHLYNPLDPHDSRNRRVAITVLSESAYENRLKVGPITAID